MFFSYGPFSLSSLLFAAVALALVVASAFALAVPRWPLPSRRDVLRGFAEIAARRNLRMARFAS